LVLIHSERVCELNYHKPKERNPITSRLYTRSFR